MIVRCYECADTVLTKTEEHYVRPDGDGRDILCTTCGRKDSTGFLVEPDYEEVSYVEDARR